MSRRHHLLHVIPYALLAQLLLVCDQLSKFWAVGHLTYAFAGLPPDASWGRRVQVFLWKIDPPVGDPIAVLHNFWHYRYVQNPGAAWGLLAGSGSAFRTPFFLVVSLFAMGFILTYFQRSEVQQRLLRVGLALVFGGAIGNFCDRLRLGYVIDFIDWHWFNRATWPTFNVADAGITVGVALLLIDMFTAPPPVAPQTAVLD